MEGGSPDTDKCLYREQLVACMGSHVHEDEIVSESSGLATIEAPSAVSQYVCYMMGGETVVRCSSMGILCVKGLCVCRRRS